MLRRVRLRDVAAKRRRHRQSLADRGMLSGGPAALGTGSKKDKRARDTNRQWRSLFLTTCFLQYYLSEMGADQQRATRTDKGNFPTQAGARKAAKAKAKKAAAPAGKAKKAAAPRDMELDELDAEVAAFEQELPDEAEEDLADEVNDNTSGEAERTPDSDTGDGTANQICCDVCKEWCDGEGVDLGDGMSMEDFSEQELADMCYSCASCKADWSANMEAKTLFKSSDMTFKGVALPKTLLDQLQRNLTEHLTDIETNVGECYVYSDGLDGNCIIGEGAISAALVNAIGTLLRGALHRELTATTELLVGIKDFRPDVPPATYVLCVSDGGAESWSVVLDVPMDGDTIVSLPCDHGRGGRGTATIDADSMETDEAALETIVLSAHSIEIPLSVWQEYVSGSLALVRLMVHAKTNGELMEDTCSRGHAPNVKCPYCSVDARQMGMLGMDVDPPLEEGRLWELDRRTHAKEAIFSIIDKLVDIAIADGESYDCVNGEVIRADLVSKVSADWFSNALGEDAADDIQMQVTRLDAAVLQWMQEQVKGSTGKPSKSEKLTYLWPKIVRSWSTSGGGGRITVLQRVTARFMTTDGKTIAPSKSGHTIIASAMQRHCIACRHCVVDLR